MPRECLDCKYVSLHDDATQCDRCGGGRMRFSLLAGMKFRERKAEAVRAKVGTDDRPGMIERFGQAARYLMMSQATAFILLGAAVFATPDAEIPKAQAFSKLLETVVEVYPFWSLVGAIAIPVLAAGIGVVFGLRNVYLAQQMGVLLAPISAMITLGGASALGGPTPVLAWLAAPPLSAALAFLAGIRMTGFVRAKSEAETNAVEYKPIDSWDREAQPKMFDLRVAKQGHMKRLMIGIAAGAIASQLLPFVLTVFSGASPAEMGNALRIFGWAGVCIAGLFAGAGTNAPVVQGAIAGLLMYAVRRYAHLNVFTPEAMFQLWLHAAVGVLGGFGGRFFFPPPQVVRGRARCKSDGVVYVGDQLVKESA
jgi:hypothetical protein